ncbi:MAG: maleylacetate reductase [Pseudonocardiaceae bacterium]
MTPAATSGFVHDVPASRVVFGTGRIRQVPEEVERFGAERVLLIAGRREKVYADELAAALGSRVVDRIGEVVMHVPVALATAAAERTERSGADLLVCLGGGSAIGLAKAVALRTRLPILAIPTTYAGSEMTPIWGLTDGGRKTTGRDRTVLPATVVYDPALTTSLPIDISAASGMNALAHLIEALYAPDASPVTAVLAEEGIRVLADALSRVVVAPDDLDARACALYGAWLAGWVLGTAGMGLHHKICHVLGGAYNLPHAGTHSAVLPFVTAYNAPAAPAAMVHAARALGAQDPARALWELAERIGAPTSLAQVGMDPGRIPEAARLVVESPPVNPRPVDEAAVAELLRAAHAGMPTGT